MRPRVREISSLLACVSLAAMPIRAGAQGTTQSCPPSRTALVLAGGGAKGFAHIGGRGGGPTGPLSLDRASTALMTAAMGLQGADVAPTDRQVAAVTAARTQAAVPMAKWKALTTTGLAALNAKRKSAGENMIAVPK